MVRLIDEASVTLAGQETPPSSLVLGQDCEVGTAVCPGPAQGDGWSEGIACPPRPRTPEEPGTRGLAQGPGQSARPLLAF